MPYQDTSFSPAECTDLAEMQYQTRALATDLGMKGFGLGSEPVDIAREVYRALLAYQAREQQARETVARMRTKSEDS